ncbi:hypothetical protein QJS83_04700 [Bdellovibrio sp. 22V]|uniref:hypothetical protein n=1 Tax=Bdellovibrio sp. 22V TaxID=3044166 RepID=UPI0025431A29|nr:hypothetical protein [Bdellovibrio sp. 22V]WII73171.1 hypothetical protein QJS83_04700 [Bdellovibrio sp. 22V]
MKSLVLSKIVVIAPMTLSFSTALALNLSELRGDARTEYRSPQGLTELCVISKKYPGGKYKNGDIEKERQLCAYNFYTNMGICPKYNSTNPAILMLQPNAKYSKPAIDASNCNLDKMDVKTEAKFKQSITCSHTPSILSYYHVSRILGGVGRVPPTVIRTMDKSIHQRLTVKANNYLRGSREEIAQAWRIFADWHKSPRLHPNVFDNSQTQVFGALSDNVKNEEKYMEVSGRGSYETRYERFMKQAPFLRVSSAQSVAQLAGSTNFKNVAQTALQMKDVSDMILLDTLLNQQDRIGNIHYKFYWYYLDPQNPGKIQRDKSDAEWVNEQLVVPPQETQKMAPYQAALVKEMVLKDNDCGISKTNMMRKYSVLEKVRHMSYQTYRNFLAFHQSLNTQDSRDYFQQELLFSSAEFASLQQNAAKARQILVEKCQSGQLKFDVDLENYVPGANLPSVSCL